MENCKKCKGHGTIPLKATYKSSWFSPKGKDKQPETEVIEVPTICPDCNGSGKSIGT